MDIVWDRHPSSDKPELQSLPKGSCFILTSGSTVYMKTDRYEHGQKVLALSMSAGCLYALDPCKRVIPLTAALHVSAEDC